MPHRLEVNAFRMRKWRRWWSHHKNPCLEVVFGSVKDSCSLKTVLVRDRWVNSQRYSLKRSLKRSVENKGWGFLKWNTWAYFPILLPKRPIIVAAYPKVWNEYLGYELVSEKLNVVNSKKDCFETEKNRGLHRFLIFGRNQINWIYFGCRSLRASIGRLSFSANGVRTYEQHDGIDSDNYKKNSKKCYHFIAPYTINNAKLRCLVYYTR